MRSLNAEAFVVTPEVSFRTVDGRRLVPDLVLKDSAQYVVETKLGAETKLLDTMMKLYEMEKIVRMHENFSKGRCTQ